MSEDPEKKKHKEGRPQYSKGPKNTKSNYDSRQHNDKESGNTRYEQDSGPQRSNDGYRRENRQNDNQYYQNKNSGYNKDSGYSKGIKRAGVEQINRRKKNEPQPKISKDVIIERHKCIVTLEKDFQEIIDTNPQIFVKDSLLPVNLEFEPLDAPGDDCLNPKPAYTGNSSNNPGRSTQSSKTEGNNQEQEIQKPEREERGFVEWDTGDGKDLFEELDSKKMDDQLRGKKKQIGGGEEKKAKKAKEPEVETKKIEEEKKAEKIVENVQKEDTLKADIDEDEGEYSNIDKIFEQKMKAKQFEAYNPEEEDYGLQAEEELQSNQNKLEKDLDDNPPVWEEFNAEDIKKDVENMDSLFIGTADKQQTSKNAYDQFIGDFSGAQYSKDGGKNYGFENNYGDSSTESQRSDSSRNYLTPQQQQELMQYQQQMMMKQQQNPNKMPENFGYNPNIQGIPIQSPKMGMGRQTMGNNPNFSTMQQNQQILYNQQQQQQQMYQMQGQGTKGNPTTIGLSKQIPATQQSKVFKFFCRDDYEKKLWFYKDFQNKVQGPFSAKEMDEWYDNGLLPLTLMITYGENNNFKTLSELISYINSNSGKQLQQQQQKQTFQTSTPKQSGPINFSTISLVQMNELLKDPDFIQYAQATRLNIPQIINSIKEREQQEKYYAMNKNNFGYNQGYPSGGPTNGNFDSQGGYYQNVNQNFAGNQQMNKGSFTPTQGGTNMGQDFGFGKQTQQFQNVNNYNSPNMNMAGPTNKGYPMQQQQMQPQKLQKQPIQQFSTQQQYPMQQQFTQQEQQYSNQGYPTSLNLNNAILQNTQQRPQQTFVQPQSQGTDLMTNQLKSILGLGGGDLSGLIGGGDVKKNEESAGGGFNSADFPAFK